MKPNIYSVMFCLILSLFGCTDNKHNTDGNDAKFVAVNYLANYDDEITDFTITKDQLILVGKQTDSAYIFDIGNNIGDLTFIEAIDLSSLDHSIRGLTFNEDGGYAYLIGAGNKSIYQLRLTTPYSLQNYTLLTTFIYSKYMDQADDFQFSPDGTILAVFDGEKLHRFDLTDQWNIATAKANNSSPRIQDYKILGFIIVNDILYVTTPSTDGLHSYQLSDYWDVGQITYRDYHFSTANQDTLPSKLFFGDGGIFILGRLHSSISQYQSTLSQ